MQDLLTRLLLAGGGGFSPSALFGGGAVQGAWYDPSDFGTTGTGGVGTLFQDSAGTTPVTAVEQPVGLMLDKSKGLVLGPELVTNGNPFVSGSWTLAANWSVVGGKLQSDGTQGGFTYAGQTISISSGKRYKVTVTVSSVNNAGLKIILSGGAQVLNPTAPGVYTAYFPYVSTALIQFESGSGTTCVIDSISVRELPGNHAFQSTSASRPTLRARYNLLTYSQEFTNAAWTQSGLSSLGTGQTAPDGTATANSLVENNLNARHLITQSVTHGSGAHTLSWYVKANGRTWCYMRTFITGTDSFAYFNLSGAGSTGTVSGELSAPSIVALANGWYRISASATFAAAGRAVYVGCTTADNTPVSLGDGTSGILAWGAQLAPTAVFPSNTYQRIGAATDYATGTAFPPYLFFDGTDDSMLTNSVDFATVTSDGQARRNLLNSPTLFNDTVNWAVARATIAVSTAVSPPTGVSNLFKLTEDTTASNTHQFLSAIDTTVVNGTRYVTSIYARAAERSWIQLQEGQGVTAGAYFDLANGVVGTVSGTGSPIAAIQNIGGGWYRCSVSWVASGTAARVRVYLATGDNGAIYTGDGTSGAYLSAAQLETGSTATAFQNIGTDQMTVFAGVTKNSDAATGMLIELSAVATSNNGAFLLDAPDSATNRYGIAVRGTNAVVLTTTSSAFNAPVSNVLTLTGNIAAPLTQLRANGTVALTNSGSLGTGNFGNYPLFIGRRNNATFPFNGNLYSLIVQGATPTSSQLVSTEQWVAAKTPLGSV